MTTYYTKKIIDYENALVRPDSENNKSNLKEILNYSYKNFNLKKNQLIDKTFLPDKFHQTYIELYKDALT